MQKRYQCATDQISWLNLFGTTSIADMPMGGTRGSQCAMVGFLQDPPPVAFS